MALSDPLSENQRQAQLYKYHAYFWGFIAFADKSAIYDHRDEPIDDLLRSLIPTREEKWLSNMLHALVHLRFLLTKSS